jgi:outer membrane receptor for ferrienterochelin and colicins
MRAGNFLDAEGGITWQQSRYDEPVAWSKNVPGTRSFTRSPDVYGYITLGKTFMKNLRTSISVVYTGPMLVPHRAGAPGVEADALVTSPHFIELNANMELLLTRIVRSRYELSFHCGIKNIINSYQNDFDTGPNRDSNYIYGPGLPRSFLAGFTLKNGNQP